MQQWSRCRAPWLCSCKGAHHFPLPSTSTDGSWFSFEFLMTWTLLLAGYSWYMLYNMNQHSNVQTPLMPDMLNLTAEPPVTHEATSIKGLVTWTLVRVRRRLQKVQAAGNIGSCMRYTQIQRWLETCLCHLPTATGFDRNKVLSSIGDENVLSEDEDADSPTAGMGEHERNLMINSHGEVHHYLVRLLELQRNQATVEFLKVSAEAFKTPDPPPQDSDESMIYG